MLELSVRCISQILCLGPATLMRHVCTSNCCGKHPPFSTPLVVLHFLFGCFQLVCLASTPFFLKCTVFTGCCNHCTSQNNKLSPPYGSSALVFNTWHCASVKESCTVPHQCATSATLRTLELVVQKGQCKLRNTTDNRKKHIMQSRQSSETFRI